MGIRSTLKGLLCFAVIMVISLNAVADIKDIEYGDVVSWASKKITVWSPPGRTFYPDALETSEEALSRYRSIANDALSVAFDPQEAPLFKGPYGRMRTAALILAVARSESGFRKDVDFGLGPHSKGDGGQSWCLMQVKLGMAVKGRTKLRLSMQKEGVKYNTDDSSWGGEDLISDRQKCFRAGLHIMRNSFLFCAHLPVEERLSSYTSGSCDNGKDSSKVRVGSAMRWLSVSPPPASDQTLFEIIEKMKITPIVASPESASLE